MPPLATLHFLPLKLLISSVTRCELLPTVALKGKHSSPSPRGEEIPRSRASRDQELQARARASRPCPVLFSVPVHGTVISPSVADMLCSICAASRSDPRSCKLQATCPTETVFRRMRGVSCSLLLRTHPSRAEHALKFWVLAYVVWHFNRAHLLPGSLSICTTAPQTSPPCTSCWC